MGDKMNKEQTGSAHDRNKGHAHGNLLFYNRKKSCTKNGSAKLTVGLTSKRNKHKKVMTI